MMDTGIDIFCVYDYTTTDTCSEIKQRFIIKDPDNAQILDILDDKTEISILGKVILNNCRFTLLDHGGHFKITTQEDDKDRLIIRKSHGDIFCVSADNKYLLACNQNRNYRVWDLNTGREQMTVTQTTRLPPPSAEITEVNILPGKHLPRHSWQIKAWRPNSRYDRKYRLPPPLRKRYNVFWQKALSWSNFEYCWSRNPGEVIRAKFLQRRAKRAIFWVNYPPLPAPPLQIIDVRSGKEVVLFNDKTITYPLNQKVAQNLVHYIIMAEDVFQIKALDTDKIRHTLKRHYGDVLAFTADNKYALMREWDDNCRVWDLESAEEILAECTKPYKNFAGESFSVLIYDSYSLRVKKDYLSDPEESLPHSEKSVSDSTNSIFLDLAHILGLLAILPLSILIRFLPFGPPRTIFAVRQTTDKMIEVTDSRTHKNVVVLTHRSTKTKVREAPGTGVSINFVHDTLTIENKTRHYSLEFIFQGKQTGISSRVPWFSKTRRIIIQDRLYALSFSQNFRYVLVYERTKSKYRVWDLHKKGMELCVEHTTHVDTKDSYEEIKVYDNRPMWTCFF